MSSKRSTAPAAVRWTAYISVAIVFAIACAFLSHWQLTKNAERTEQLTVIADNYHARPVPLGDMLPAGHTLSITQQWHPVTLTGTYVTARQLLVRNRVNGGAAGFEVVVPFRQTDGRLFLIDRGWIPASGDSDLSHGVVPAPPRGPVTVVARLMPGEPLPPSGVASHGQLPSIHLPLAASIVGAVDGHRLDTGAYAIMMSEDPAPATAPHALDPPSADPGPYLSYGIQWILFAVMGFIFIWYVIRTERRVHREEAEEAAELAALAAVDPEAAERRLAEVDATHRRIRPAAGRTDRDADVEDEMADRLLR